MDTQHPLYYHCKYDPSYERYGLLHNRSNTFFIIEHDLELIKKVQLTAMRYEVLHLVNIDHYFNFLDKTQKTVDKYQIKSMTDAHSAHARNAAVYLNDKSRIDSIQKVIDNHNCEMFGLTVTTAWSTIADVNHYRLTDNIIKHESTGENSNHDYALQEKIFLIRRILYLLKGVFHYVKEFVTLQEKICDQGLVEYQKHFALCAPSDTTIARMVREELEINQIRLRSIQQLHDTIYKRFNEINLNQSSKSILLEFSSTIWSNDCMLEMEKRYPEFQPSYDINKIRTILKNEVLDLIKHYDEVAKK